MKQILLISLVCLNMGLSNAQVNIIFDTDFGGDADDLGAVAMLHNYVDKGKCNLLAIMSWQTEEKVIPALDAVNRFYNHPNIPLGIRHSGGWHTAEWNYTHPLAEKLPYKLSNDDVMEATALYRKILAGQKDKSVVIVTVGPLANIENLLKSEADEYSNLNGKELVKKKVEKFVIMGGKFPSGEGEWNFDGGMENVTKYACDNIPVPVVFSGFELGVQIKTGAVFNQIDKNHPLYIGFKHFSEHAPWMKEYYKEKILDNSTYDQTAVLYAVEGGTGEYWTKVENGYCVADEKGNNHWVEGDKHEHAYLVLKEAPEEMAKLIEAIMLGE
ncbi:MAG: nucleoside hydrolase [Bacteroidota bacterium]